MAKRKKKTRRGRGTAVTAGAAAVPNETAALSAAPGACQLRPVAGTPDFEATTGATVSLFTHDHVGQVRIAKAEYGGALLVPNGQATKLSLTVKAGTNTLKLVCAFTATTNGNGELREDCGSDSHFIRALFSDEPLQLIRITGK